MTCIKTGCDVAFVSTPQNQFRADAFYFNGNLIFSTTPAIHNPGGNIDFLIDDTSFDSYQIIPGGIVASVNTVVLQDIKIAVMILDYHPEIYEKLRIQLGN